ncbi:Receptor-like protein kinase ANXUR2 [Apostasia shenzhenica]|uniref:non-specific serine/threonine protein kinase n=1 Tax=Apostasia shenzhenica TaxID=1088818 RepID=A0A2I0AGI8_9ASPA|nr:Receptor-like protein kinase ANXUR2 [Apostasia shenzhenica]PKA54671.1 Receptor-like protein kinase ANXUR2 [Apostasia shenzhenica]
MKTVSFIVLLLLYHSLFAGAQGGYSPSDAILLNCGSSSDDADADGRKWIGDSSSKASSAGVAAGKSTPSTAAFQDPSLPSAVPYMTAAIFKSESAYKFSVSKTDRHWVRLHFYPSSYNGLNPEDAFFSVTASGGLTLAKNFSAYITAQALTQGYIVREFSLPPVSDGTLTLTFTPAGDHPSSYAFVNGIEVLSMPDIFVSPATMVSFSDDQSLQVGSSALQTMYRLNVGGQYIPPTNDTGLSRTWYDDTPYLTGAGVGVTIAAGPRTRIQYPAVLPEFIAPPDVYRTARQMGPDPKVNIQYNLSWSFQIDANFTYLVRLHFCELQLTKVNQRVFDVFVNNQTAEKDVDVIAIASARAVPVFKDYAVYVSDGRSDDEELVVALHPASEAKPEYYDSILNGMEIFKLGDSGGNLAGPNPKPSQMLENDLTADGSPTFQSDSHRKVSVISGAAGGAAAVGLFFVICFAVHQRKKRIACSSDAAGASGWLPLYGNSHTTGSKSTISGKSCASSNISNMAAGLCRHFSIIEIKQGTKNFDESLVIGVGGFGKVYKGVIDGGATKVAIKRSNPNSEQGVNEFQTEIEMLSKLRHKHLVSLIGYCEEDGEMCLVYDYMAFGTLREHLYKASKAPLSWKQRLEICIGAARGLHYLHTGAKYTIIHRDVKTTNILLDENWVAKVSDFGLSKTGPTMNQGHVSTVVKGSFGYLDPEYFRRQQLTEKSDVYSFGVVLFEVLCSRPALNPSLSKEQVSLADWALQNQRKGTLSDIIDPHLKGKMNPECLKKFAETAEKCLSDHGIDRPSMGDVLWNLEFALQLQENAHNGSSGEVGGEGSVGSHRTTGSIGGSSQTTEESDGNDSAIFSQLINPKGR